MTARLVGDYPGREPATRPDQSARWKAAQAPARIAAPVAGAGQPPPGCRAVAFGQRAGVSWLLPVDDHRRPPTARRRPDRFGSGQRAARLDPRAPRRQLARVLEPHLHLVALVLGRRRGRPQHGRRIGRPRTLRAGRGPIVSSTRARQPAPRRCRRGPPPRRPRASRPRRGWPRAALGTGRRRPCRSAPPRRRRRTHRPGAAARRPRAARPCRRRTCGVAALCGQRPAAPRHEQHIQSRLADIRVHQIITDGPIPPQHAAGLS